MNYIFDTSSIFKAIQKNSVRVLINGHTLDLARYELGNLLWKKYILRGLGTRNDLSRITRVVKDALNLMVIFPIECHEERILDLAKELKLTFYDTSYVYHAVKSDLPLVTEDADLAKKAGSKVKVLNINELFT